MGRGAALADRARDRRAVPVRAAHWRRKTCRSSASSRPSPTTRASSHATGHRRSAGRHRRHRRGEPAARRPLPVVARPAGAARRKAAGPAPGARGRIRRGLRRARHVGRRRRPAATRARRSRERSRLSVGHLRTAPQARLRRAFAEAMRGQRDGAGVHVQRQEADRGVLPPPAFTRSRPWPVCDSHRAGERIHGKPGQLQRAAAAAGHIDPVYDSDGVVRRVPLLKRYQNGFYPALALAVAQVVVEASPSSRISIPTTISSARPGRAQGARRQGRHCARSVSRQQKTFQYDSAAAVMAGEVRPTNSPARSCSWAPRRRDCRMRARRRRRRISRAWRSTRTCSGHPQQRTAVGARRHGNVEAR